MARVRVSLTVVACAKTKPFVPFMLSQADAAAVTEEVSLIAVPANKANPSSDKPIILPSVGNIKAAITLNKNITEIERAISSSEASMTGAVAATAEPPQIEDPTPTKIDTFLSIFNNLQIINAVMSDVAIVEIITGRDWLPTDKTVLIFRENPKIITAYCNIFFDVNVTPAFIESEDAKLGKNAVIIIPIIMANTGAPMISKEKEPILRLERIVEVAATAAAIAIPRPLFLINSTYNLHDKQTTTQNNIIVV